MEIPDGWESSAQRAVHSVRAAADEIVREAYPTAQRNPLATETAATAFQDGMIDWRDVRDSNAFTARTPFGTLPAAVRRAQQRFSDRPTPLLVIGAGQRAAERQLHETFGDSIRLTEASPVYSSSPGVDTTLKSVDADHLDLGDHRFVFTYSIMGSFYGGKQLGILQTALDHTVVGGEVFLMWNIGDYWPLQPINRRLARIARGNPGWFRHAGLDLVVNTHPSGMRDPVACVWARKHTETINVRALFAEAGRAKNAAPATFRFSPDTDFYPATLLATEAAKDVTRTMLEATLQAFSIGSAASILQPMRLSVVAHGDGDASALLVDHFLAAQRANLTAAIPLSTLMISDLADPAATVSQAFVAPFTEPKIDSQGHMRVVMHSAFQL